MKGQMDTKYGKVLIDTDVIATYAGSVAVECFGIVGMAAIGCLTAAWIGISSPLAFDISGNTIVIQEYLDQLCPQLLSLAATLGILSMLRKGVNTTKIMITVIVVAFVLGVFGIIA